MQWAIRSREASRSAGVRLANGSNLVFIDPSSLRRSTTGSTAVAASSEPVAMSTSASSLARAFGKLNILQTAVFQNFNFRRNHTPNYRLVIVIT